ncbi:MAG: glycosyltransferase [Stygiobacter sp.]
MKFEISVIICTYNPKETYINQAIDAILNQDFPKGKWEFFIVDNNSSFKVADIKKIKENNIKVIEETTPGLTAARECGARNANGDIIVFVDDDNILKEDYLTNVSLIFEKYKDLGVVSGEILPIYEVEPPKWFYHFENSIAVRRFKNNFNYFTRIPVYNIFFPIGAGMSIRKDILIQYFEDLKRNIRIEGRRGNSLSSGEDLDIDFYALSLGYEIGSTKRLSLKHIIPKSRIDKNYLIRLNSASLKSSLEIKKKWENIFYQTIFDFFRINKYLLFIKTVLVLPLIFIKSFSIRFNSYISLLRITIKEI